MAHLDAETLLSGWATCSGYTSLAALADDLAHMLVDWDVFALEREFVQGDALYGFIRKHSVEFVELTRAGLNPRVAITALLYRVGRNGNGLAMERHKGAHIPYLLTLPLVEYLKPRWPDLARLLERRQHELERLPSAWVGQQRAVAAGAWGPLRELVRQERRQFERHPYYLPLDESPGLLVQGLMTLRGMLDLIWQIEDLKMRRWTEDLDLDSHLLLLDPRLPSVVARIRKRAGLSDRWQRGMESFLLTGSTVLMWRNALNGVGYELTSGSRLSGHHLAVVITRSAFRSPSVSVQDERLAADLMGAVRLLGGFGEPDYDRSGGSSLTLFRDLRMLNIYEVRLRADGIRPGDSQAIRHHRVHSRVADQITGELTEASSAGYSFERRRGRRDAEVDPLVVDEATVRAVLIRWKKVLPALDPEFQGESDGSGAHK